MLTARPSRQLCAVYPLNDHVTSSNRTRSRPTTTFFLDFKKCRTRRGDSLPERRSLKKHISLLRESRVIFLFAIFESNSMMMLFLK